MPAKNKYETLFFNALRDLFVGAKVEGDSGYINLMKIKAGYFENGVSGKLHGRINEVLLPFPDFREELFDKLYTFFQRYFSESGSIYFRHTAVHQNVYEKVYTDDRDVVLFWKTHMLYYVKTDRIFNSMGVEVDGFKFYFDAGKMTLKKSNEKRETIYAFRAVDAQRQLVFEVTYSEKGRKTRMDDILKDLKKADVKINDETLTKAFRVFEKQSEVDYFINKDARSFLREQFDIWLYQYLFAGQNIWTQERLAQLQALKEIAFNIIDFISQFEDELVKVWNKPKFVRNSHYVITLDKLAEAEVLTRILAHPQFEQQLQEWRDFGMLGADFRLGMLTEKDLTSAPAFPKYQYLPLDTQYFPDLELDILALFDDLDAALDGWLVHSENYQALSSLYLKFGGKANCIYIDPPYNAETSEIHYVNTYKHSSFASIIEDRVDVSKHYLAKEFVYFIAIDDVEQRLVGDILTQRAFKDNTVVCIPVIHNRRGQQGKNISTVHEYCYVIYPNDKTKFINDREFGEIDHRILRDSGTESLRTDAATCFYPILVKEGKVVGFGSIPDDAFHPSAVNELLEDGIIQVWPLDGSRVERKWRYSRESVESIITDLEVVEVKATKKKPKSFQIYFNKSVGSVKSVWESEKYDASEYGTKVLQSLFSPQITEEFKYPKSINLVADSIFGVLPLSNSGLILDFFAGSGTTAHAVMNLNRADGGKRKYILVEMGEHFNTVILPRVKKVAFSSSWKDGKANGGQGLSHFVKYYDLEQYEETLKQAHYQDSDLFDNPYEKPWEHYIFLRDEKMLAALDVDVETNSVQVHPERLYPDIDLAETLSQRRGKWIKRITAESVELEDGEVLSLADPDWQTLKPLIWW